MLPFYQPHQQNTATCNCFLITTTFNFVFSSLLHSTFIHLHHILNYRSIMLSLVLLGLLSTALSAPQVTPSSGPSGVATFNDYVKQGGSVCCPSNTPNNGRMYRTIQQYIDLMKMADCASQLEVHSTPVTMARTPMYTAQQPPTSLRTLAKASAPRV